MRLKSTRDASLSHLMAHDSTGFVEDVSTQYTHLRLRDPGGLTASFGLILLWHCLDREQ